MQHGINLKRALACALLVNALAWPFSARAEDGSTSPFAQAARVAIVSGGADAAKAAELLGKRILKRSEVAVEATSADALSGTADVFFVVGTANGSGLVSRLVEELGARLPMLPNTQTLHPEGYGVRSGTIDGRRCVVIAGTDLRGTLYGVGAVLRALAYLPDRVVVPALDLTDKPAFVLRGGSPTGPSDRARQYSDLRPQTREELVDRIEDIILVGANTVGGDLELVRSYGMQSYFSRKANELPPGQPFPREWAADDGRSTRYVCPSVPEARQALLEAFDKWFAEEPFREIWATKSGDPGGCRCDRCEPWGATYIKLVHEIADILHKHHPDTRVIATNQDLSNEGNLAIFEYLNTHDSSWLYAIRYGPGADEMQTYIRGPVNPRWFQYEGFGPLGNYLRYMHHELPRTTTIVGFTDVTHWMQSQYAVERPDIALAAVYNRRSWNARPRNFHRVGREILHYLDGDLYYSEGQHDEFNKWFWHRMLWNPNFDAETITKEYCRYFFGPEAQDAVAEAIFLMEETLEQPVIDNPGILRAVELLRDAGSRIPENYLRSDFRWRIIMQKALMDRYIQLALQRGRVLKEEAGRHLAAAATAENPRGALESALAVLERPIETEEMRAIKEEALQRGEESNAIIGYREPALFLAERYDLTEVGWWTERVREALSSGDEARMQNAARMILHYGEPGEGGFYDDVGWPAESERLTRGETLWGFRPVFGPAKMSHYGLAYNFGAEEGIQFEYEGLDPQVRYVVRVAAGARGGPERLELTERLTADGAPIGEPFAVPSGSITFYECDVPEEATRDGRLRIGVLPGEGMPASAVSEIWLMRKDGMPWTVRH
jgi:hypothetical protein